MTKEKGAPETTFRIRDWDPGTWNLELGTGQNRVEIPNADEFEISYPRTASRRLPLYEYMNNG